MRSASPSMSSDSRRKMSLNDAEDGPDPEQARRLLLRSGHETPGADSAYMELNQYTHLAPQDGAMNEAEVSALIGQNQFAVQATDLERDYGSINILKKLDINVPVGAIYGLLGPSGCGKSTLIKTMLGQLDVHGGAIKVFGRAPGAADHPVPGPAVGYMPQDLALEPEFSIEECVRFHSKLHGMSEEVYTRRKNELLDLLDMPPEDRLVRNLSGGQKRRVSLMVALIHRPPLLLLDEPTVGIDPLLRSRIWSYLVDLTSQTGCTVIITTHYIGEAEQADMVGFMRAGEILAEGKPADLMQRHGKKSLEDTFLALCFDQADDPSPAAGGPRALDADAVKTKRKGGTKQFNPPPPPSPFRCRVVGALMWKGLSRMKRSAAFLAFQFLVPSIQVILFCLAIGGNPQHLGLAIVNQDAPGPNQTLNYGAGIVASLGEGDSFDLITASSREEAVRTVEDGRSWGCLYIPPNFTEAAVERYQNHNIDGSTVSQSTLELQLDATDLQISTFVTEAVTDALSVIVNATANPQELEPVYGDRHPKFTDFVAPGIVISIAFSGAIGLTAVSFVAEKKSGLMERAWAAGVRPTEILLSHVCQMFIILFIQISLLLMFSLLIFDLPMVGSLPLAVAMAQLLGLCGMVYGLVIASSVDNEEAASQLALSSFFPALLLSGVIWPLQAIPRGLYYVSLALPTTWAAEAMRSIMARGWGMLDQRVWIGFCVVGGWTLLFFVCSVRSLKSRKA